MKYLILPAIFFTISIHAQDTTSWQAVGVGIGDEFNFYRTDSTYQSFVPYSGFTGPGHAIFMNPADSLLYALLGDGSDDRNLYSVNPFTGDVTLVHDIAETYLVTMDISEDGNTLYGIQGNGGGTLGAIFEITWGSWTESNIGNFNGLPGQSSYGIEYHPSDSALYAFEGSWSGAGFTYVQRFDLGTTGISADNLTPNSDSQIHGALWTGADSVFLVFEGQSCSFFRSDATSFNLTEYYTSCTPYTNDIEVFHTIRRAGNTMQKCPDDSLMISIIYPGINFTWYRNGVPLIELNDTLWISLPGTYKALYQIDATNYMWSEPVVVTNFSEPIVTISSAGGDTVICEPETILLTGAFGGTLQWFLNGAAVPGATVDTYLAAEPGEYNQEKINLMGCSDTADEPFIIYPSLADFFITEATDDTLICPGDTLTLTGTLESAMQWLLDGAIIPGATTPTYNATIAGTYEQVATNADACTDTSANAYIIYDDPDCNLGYHEEGYHFEIYPNPAGDLLTFESDLHIRTLVILDLDGRKILEMNIGSSGIIQIDASTLSGGFYVLRFQTESGLITRKFTKL